MEVLQIRSGAKLKTVIETIENEDFKRITKARYFFNWKTEQKSMLFKLRLRSSLDILGLISLKHYPEEQRFEIVLLAVSKENRGSTKQYEGITGNLMAYAAREAIKLYAEKGCISLFPKTELKAHYMKKYGMLDAGRQVFLEGRPLLKLIKTYNV